jgi:hypothetical protein
MGKWFAKIVLKPLRRRILTNGTRKHAKDNLKKE